LLYYIEKKEILFLYYIYLFLWHVFYLFVLFQYFYHFYFNFLIFLIIYFGSREKNLNALLFLPKKPLGKEGKEVDKEWKKF